MRLGIPSRENPKSGDVNHRILEKLTQCPVIWNHIQSRLIEEWVQDSSRSVSSMPLLTQGWAPFPSVEISAVSSDNGERVWRFHIVFTRSSSVNAMTDLDTGKRSTVCRTTNEDMFNKVGVSLTLGYHWVVQVLRNCLSVYVLMFAHSRPQRDIHTREHTHE